MITACFVSDIYIDLYKNSVIIETIILSLQYIIAQLGHLNEPFPQAVVLTF